MKEICTVLFFLLTTVSLSYGECCFEASNGVICVPGCDGNGVNGGGGFSDNRVFSVLLNNGFEPGTDALVFFEADPNKIQEVTDPQKIIALYQEKPSLLKKITNSSTHYKESSIAHLQTKKADTTEQLSKLFAEYSAETKGMATQQKNTIEYQIDQHQIKDMLDRSSSPANIGTKMSH